MKWVSFILVSFFFVCTTSAQTIVRTSQELKTVLSLDQEVGVVLLDGDWFNIEGLEVKMGGKIKPFGRRRPVLVGFQQTVKKRNDTKVIGGYWTTRINGYGAAHYIFLDESFEAIKRATTVDGKEFMYLKASDLQRTNKSTRAIKIRIPSNFASLLNKDEKDLKTTMLKVGYWFVQFNVFNLKSDGVFLYGQIDNSYNYNLLDIRPEAKVTVSFFNIPFEDGGVFLDGKDILHVPSYYSTVRVCCSDNILTLKGDRELTIEGLTFAGSMTPIEIQGANKHINKCYFKNCGRGIHCDYGVTNMASACSVIDCRFENLYNNNAITFVGCDDVVVANNNIHRTGTVNKGGCVIQVGGNSFKVEHNIIQCYSYIGIYAGISRQYAAARMTGCIKDNLVDNLENWGQANRQLTDGGGIYVIAHTDGVVIENNIVRNIGYDGGELWGIYLDGGAYNCTTRRNLIYNLWPGHVVMASVCFDECEHSCMNNIVEDNIFIGSCKISGNRNGYGNKTVIRNNYIAGDLMTLGDEFVEHYGNKFVSATVEKDGKIVLSKGERIRKRGFTRSIKRLIKG